MSKNYSATEHLRDGQEIEIRALRPDDRDGMLAAIERTGKESLRRRFFAPKHSFSENEIAFFMDIDFSKHIALVALGEEHESRVIIGGGRCIVTEPEKAEVAFVVIDGYQGRGIGTLLMHHLARIARAAGLKELSAEVLSGNAAMRRVFNKFGFREIPSRDPRVLHLVLAL